MASTTKQSKPNPFRRVTLFLSETMEELRKASWPNWPELRDSTTLVIFTVVLLGGFISVSDFSLFNLITWITRHV